MCKMIKYTVFLVALFSFSRAGGILEEIRVDLGFLQAHENKTTFNATLVLFPTTQMLRYPCSHLQHFLRDLRSMLEHVTVKNDDSVVTRLQANTDSLIKEEKNTVKRNIQKKSPPARHFKLFLKNNIKYIQNWNERCSHNNTL